MVGWTLRRQKKNLCATLPSYARCGEVIWCCGSTAALFAPWHKRAGSAGYKA
ncbi:putrescine carbamoyltransferase [Acetobacter orientalis]|uniref:Putrescine carbamoyltransferase n=1 Tax=Acetobacter orientalis TaxID=146474 RepID=A0A2Z5ZG17_9PROT|nr:putrescine carbamoyltransferase [Acetobacter orientalis]